MRILILSRTLIFICLGSLLIMGLSCGSSPTEADAPSLPPAQSQPSISISASPASGGTDAEVTFTISVKGNSKEIKVFGLDLTFETKMFKLQGVGKGGLTSSWAAVNGNEIESGKVRIGGFTGAGTSIPVNRDGSIAKVKLKVTGNSLADGAQSQVCIKDYTDDIQGIAPDPACVRFTYKK